MSQVRARYEACLEELLERLEKLPGSPLEAAILHGGFWRDPTPIFGWSDIDVLLLLRPVPLVVSHVGDVRESVERAHGIRLDIGIWMSTDLDRPYDGSPLNSEALNALSLRSGRVIWGAVPPIPRVQELQRRADILYLIGLPGLVRRYCLDEIYFERDPRRAGAHLQRLTRWAFSATRVSLRVEGVECNPYEDTVEYLRGRGDQGVSLLERLVVLRRGYADKRYECSRDTVTLFEEIREFVERCVDHTFRRHSYLGACEHTGSARGGRDYSIK